jgi:hypothetical protein
LEKIARFCDWLSETPVSHLFQTVAWIIPAVQSVHILAIAMVMASAIMVDLRLIGVSARSQPVSKLIARFNPWIWWSLLVLLASGAVLIAAEPRRDLLNAVFQAKMVLVILAMSVTAGLQRWAGRDAAAWEAARDSARGPNAWVSAAAVLSLVLWTAIVGCGRWIAYVEHG